jgi:4-diphosphocytidyl-2-C-methyl-D-erythritol kinase
MNSLQLPAPAKINLFLHITGRRADGYHLLETEFQFLDLADQLRFELAPELRLSGDCGDVAASDNLILRAARALLPYANAPVGAAIHLQKNIPMGAGLGGGSSDAATTLLALNQLWQLGLSLEQLAAIGLTLGADVPVFVHGRAALARGVGEQLSPSLPAEDHYLLLYPGVAIATAAIFSDPLLPRATPPLASATYDAWQLGNDCEAIACERYPEVEKARSWLVNFAPTRMTGTGSCLFARFDCARAAQECADQLPAGWQAWVCRGQNRSPLHQALAVN